MKIQSIRAREILDSRGMPTLEVAMDAEGYASVFAVPAGKSTGAHEAVELRDGGERYGGNGVQSAVSAALGLADEICAREWESLADFDGFLLEKDGTPNKSRLGGNTLLGLSGAFVRLMALTQDKPLWQFLGERIGAAPAFPRIFANLINGGKHAPGLDVQEMMVVPHADKPSDAVPAIAQIFHALGDELAKAYGPSARLAGDEGGYAPSGANHDAALATLRKLAPADGFDLAIDAAASSFYHDGKYAFEGGSITASELAGHYRSWREEYGLFSIEDPFTEDAGDDFATIMGDGLVVGDDLTVTDASRIEVAAKAGQINGVIIKPNQIGTVTETLRAIKSAHDNGVKTIISHRSGETTDDFVSDLAYGTGAFGCKIGAPCRGERVAKYNRLLAIELEVSHG